MKTPATVSSQNERVREQLQLSEATGTSQSQPEALRNLIPSSRKEEAASELPLCALLDMVDIWAVWPKRRRISPEDVLFLFKIMLFSDAWYSGGNVFINHSNKPFDCQKEWHCIKIKGQFFKETLQSTMNMYVLIEHHNIQRKNW